MCQLVVKHLLSTGKDADVYFLVGDGDEKELLPAHKLILKHASDVFEAMFRFDAKKEFSELTAQRTETASAAYPVEVTDVEPAAFKVMLSFIYTGELAELNGDNAMAVLYAAKKYNIPGLVDASLQVPVSSLRNVFLAYVQAELYELENFAYHCLFYIDENANTLFKSEEFLQIDQKLLCEIFGSDELQIREEISIWNAALRWADEKCRQNSIERSAGNRRAVLGPALFKIRFPLIPNEEFSKKIVPSGVLSKDEVIAIYQFKALPNYHEIFDRFFPMPFPTNGRISDRKNGTLLMDINKVSEFVQEEIKSSRYSEKTYINGFSWKIQAQIEKKNGSTENNEKWLVIYLLYDGPKEDLNWRCCVHSATFRIVSQKNGAENPIGTLIDRVFYNKSYNGGFENFISVTELMELNNGFYNKSKDKVTLAIDVTMKEVKMEKLILYQCKSKGTFFTEIEKVSEFAQEIFWSQRISETVHIHGFSWKILAQIRKNLLGTDNNEKWMGFYLLCDGPKEAKNWSCECSATFRIVSQKKDVPDFKDEFNDQLLNNKLSWEFFHSISFDELMDEDVVSFA
ncbi:hypothetical protein niasHS_004439 [Heterodera schachtii]|uniref:BTB domain-containing protein n=1 Tax=Heterodera schachtii TaxID=97005 RepID=A0ABD2JQZ1_HETSC